LISNFLYTIWTSGGLAGAAANDAFSVQCGVGTTMTEQDLLDGILRVTILVAVTRPAEFIVITLQIQTAS
jgi:phage tail sheath protein FI